MFINNHYKYQALISSHLRGIIEGETFTGHASTLKGSQSVKRSGDMRLSLGRLFKRRGVSLRFSSTSWIIIWGSIRWRKEALELLEGLLAVDCHLLYNKGLELVLLSSDEWSAPIAWRVTCQILIVIIVLIELALLDTKDFLPAISSSASPLAVKWPWASAILILHIAWGLILGFIISINRRRWAFTTL